MEFNREYIYKNYGGVKIKDTVLSQAQDNMEIYFLLKEGYITRNKLIGIKEEVLKLAKKNELDMTKFENLFEEEV